MKLKLKMSCLENNPRLYPLQDGTVKPDNIDLEVSIHPYTGMLFYDNLSKGLQTDISEMSLCDTIAAKERNDSLGKGRWDWTPIPVFLSRGQLWANLYVNSSSGISGLNDLRGKRIGVQDYVMTAAMWFRVILKDFYGIEAWDNVWYNWRTKQKSHGAELGLNLKEYALGKGIALHWLTVDQSADIMLDRRELDAMFPPNKSEGENTVGDPNVIDRYGGTPLTGNPRISKLLDDQGEATITEFYRKTGCYQANHHIVIRNSLLREHPWVAMEMFKALERSKEVAYERARNTHHAYLYFEQNAWKKQAAVFGQDPYPLGLCAMRKTVERAIQGALEQGLIRKPIKVEDLYFPTTLDT